MTTTERSCNPYPVGSAWDEMYGRSVWAMGPDGDDGLMVEGHDQRSWAALHRYARREGIDADPRAVDVRWFTYKDECGCTPQQHDEHRRDDGEDTCEDEQLCQTLPPCTHDGEMAWWATWFHDATDLPIDALPVLVWGW